MNKESPNVLPDATERARQVGAKLYQGDRASQALGMRVLDTTPGCARVAMQVRSDMVNGHRVCHGGLIFALADSRVRVRMQFPWPHHAGGGGIDRFPDAGARGR